jgi:hypothetical protein
MKTNSLSQNLLSKQRKKQFPLDKLACQDLKICLYYIVLVLFPNKMSSIVSKCIINMGKTRVDAQKRFLESFQHVKNASYQGIIW